MKSLRQSKVERVQPKLPKLESYFPVEKKWIWRRDRILLDVSQSPNTLVGLFDVLPLVTDLLVVVDPSSANLKEWNYDLGRFSLLVKEKVFLPLFSSGTYTSLPYALRRKDLIQDPEFLAEYESVIEEDMEDDSFVQLSEAAGIDPQDAAFSLNWDLIASQLLNSPIVTSRNMRPLWEYKFRKTLRELGEARRVPLAVTKANVLRKFLYRVVESLPSNLSVTEILEFRKNHRSRNFREWFQMELSKASHAAKVTRIRFDEEIYRDFLDLVHQHESKGSKLSGTLTVVSGLLGTALAGSPAGAIPAITGPYAFPRILRRIWRKLGHNNWVFVLLDFRSRPKL